MKKLLVLFVVLGSGCDHGSVPTVAPAEGTAAEQQVSPAAAPPAVRETVAPPRGGSCSGRLAEYCARFGGRCPTYRTSVALRAALCAQEPPWVVTTQECPGTYRSVGWREMVVGGGVEYYRPDGVLFAAYLFADYPAYCHGTSFSEAFGRIPACAARSVTRNLCRRLPPPR